MKRISGGRPDKDDLYIAQWHAVARFLYGLIGSPKACRQAARKCSGQEMTPASSSRSTGLMCCPSYFLACQWRPRCRTKPFKLSY
jgi:hypothetical protein